MAESKLYAWSPIRYGGEVKDGVVVNVKTANPGDEVSAQKLGISKDEFAALVESQAVRDRPFPKLPDGYQDSPVNYLRQQVREMEEAMSAEAADVLGSTYFGPSTEEILEDQLKDK